MVASLKEILDATATFMDQHPDRALVTVAADCELVSSTAVDVRTGRHVLRVDLARRFGGGGAAASSGHHALAALGSCLALTYRTWAAKLDIDFDRLGVELRADIDTRGALGVGDGVRPGFERVRVTVRIAGAEADERYEELHRAVLAHGSILDVFVSPVPVDTHLEIGR